jgi:hypothetical protein
MGTLDLDALRAAREELQGGSGPTVVLFGGEKFELPSEPPWDFALALSRGEQEGAFSLLFGEEGFARFLAMRPSSRDLEALIEHFDDLWPDLSGEGSSASGKSSPRTTAKPRPTSSGSTGST